MMKWDYLRVRIRNSIDDDHIAPASVWVIGNDGESIEWKKQTGDKSHAPVVGRLLSKLGDDGWELSGIVSPAETKGAVVLYFKRPKV
jgi:hypothetical protein